MKLTTIANRPSPIRRFLTLVGRSLLLRCPVCGREPLFRRWIKMHSKCPHCRVSFEREPGFFLGSIYLNYGLTSVLAATGYALALFGSEIPNRWLMTGAVVFVVLFPLLFFRHARSLWLGFDQLCDPRTTDASSPGSAIEERVGVSRLRRDEDERRA